MNWFIDPIRTQYADFTGRTALKPFWMYVLIYILVSIALSIVDSTLGTDVLLQSVYGLALLVPSWAITARRLHDTNRSGWWQLLWLVPIVGWIIIIVFLVGDSKNEGNRYGTAAQQQAPVSVPTAEVPPTQTQA